MNDEMIEMMKFYEFYKKMKALEESEELTLKKTENSLKTEGAKNDSNIGSVFDNIKTEGGTKVSKKKNYRATRPLEIDEYEKYNNENIVVELNEAKVSKSVVIKNNIPKFKINIKTEGSIAEVSGNVSITDVKVIDEIKKNSEEEIKYLVNEAINYSKDNKTDIFSFGNLVYKKNPKLWKSIEDKWESEMLNDIEVEIVVDLDLKTKGSIENIIEVN